MEWFFAVYLSAVASCGVLIIPDKKCVNFVYECMLDGESADWCFNYYIDEHVEGEE